jgi:hypothetical protein
VNKVKGLALETKMNSFLVCKMNLWRFEMHSKLYIYIYIYIYPLLDLKVVGLDDVAPTIIDKESFMRYWYIN